MKKMKKMKKILSTSLAISMLLGVAPMQKLAMAAETEKLVYNENFNGYETYSDLGGDWNVVGEGYTSIGVGKGGGKALYNSYQAEYTLDETITYGKVIVSYSIKPGTDITTVVRMVDTAQKSYILNCIKDTGEFLEGTSSDPANSFKMGEHELEKWYDFVTTIDLDAQTVTSTMTDENGESVTTPANTIKWGVAGQTEMHEITKFSFQIWPKTGEQNNKELGSYIDDFKIVRVAEDGPIFEQKEAIQTTNSKKINFETAISSGKYKLSYDFFPTSNGFLTLDRATSGAYVMNYYNKDILYYGANTGDSTAKLSDSVNAENIHHAEIIFDMDTGDSTCVVTDTITGTEYTKTRNLSWCISATGGSGNWTHEKQDVTGITVTSWSGIETNFSNIKLEKYYEGVAITQDNIIIKDSSGNIQVWDEASVDSNTITIDFGRNMKEETLTKDTVYVQNTANSKKLNYIGTYADGVYTMSLGEMLKAGAEYEIVISKDVETSEGGKNATDNTFAFYTKEPVLPLEYVLNMTEDFDEMTAFDSNWKTNVKTVLVEDGEGGKMLEQGLTTDVDNYITWLKLPTIITEGKYELSYSFKPGKGITTNILGVNLAGNTNHFFTSFAPDGKLLYGSTADTNALVTDGADVDIWYDVKVSFDFDSGESSAIIVDEKGNEWTKTRDMKWCSTNGTKISDLSKIGLQVWSKTESASYIDNIVFKQILDVPSVTADSITLLNIDGTEEENFTAVSPLTNKVTVDFGSKMDTQTLTSENIKLTNKKTGAEVSYIPTYENGVLTLNVPGILEANTTYTLTVSKDVKNAAGTELGDDVVIDFTTSDGVTKATLKKLMVGNNEITALNQLQKGDKLSICFDYANSTNVAKTLYVIAAYYYDTGLVDIDYITEDVAADITCSTYKINHTVSDTSLIDEIKIMTWDGFDTMKPLSRSLSIK